MTWVAVGLTLAASYMQYRNQQGVAKKQDNNLAAQLRSQAATRQKVSARTQDLIQQQATQTSKPQETAAAKSYNDALTANKAMATAPLANVGNVSDAYTKAKADAQAGVSTYGTNRANNVAAIEAPTQMRRDNVRNIDQYGQDVNTAWRDQHGQDFLANLKLQGIHQNPYINMLASGMKAYAGGMGGGGAGGGSTDISGNSAGGGINLSGSGGGGDPWGSYGSYASPWLQRVYGSGTNG
jgi:hypothetical protein